MNSKNSKISDHHRLWCNLTYQINLNKSDKHIALTNIAMYCTWKNIKKSYKNNKFKV